MKSKVILSGTLLVLLGSSVVWAGDPWKDKPWTDWTEKEAKKILEKSPWAKVLMRDLSHTVRYERGRYYLRWNVFWASSRTVREARRRALQLGSRVFRPAMLDENPEHIIIWVVPELQYKGFTAGIEFSMRLRPTQTPEAYLEPRGSKQKVLPASVDYLANGFALIFPRYLDGKPLFGPNEKKVRFNCKAILQRIHDRSVIGLRGPSLPQVFRLQVDFDLRKMVRDGKPDL